MLCASFVVQYKVVLGSASCKLCSAKLHWGVLCANFVVPSSTGKCFVHFVLQSLHKVLPVLLCTTKFAQSTPQYYFVLQSLHKVLPSTTSYYKVCTKYYPVLLCTTKFAQSTPQYFFVLQSLHKALPSTTLYYKVCTKYSPVLLCTTKFAQSAPQC